MSLPTMPETPERRTAILAIRALLDGMPQPPDTSPEELGPRAETVRLLGEAQAAKGAGSVNRVFVALARQEPALVALLAGDGAEAFKTLWTVAELYNADFPPPRMVVEDLLPSGLTILAGRPKVGKSWLALPNARRWRPLKKDVNEMQTVGMDVGGWVEEGLSGTH